ncbi:MAG: hypothetical protein WBJ21_07555 [Burkholderiaceae bacterium]
MRRLFLLAAMLLCLSPVVQSDDKVEHGDWTSQFQDDMGEATTHENGLSVFGMLCASGSCRYYFANSTDCETGVNYPLMLTTQNGKFGVNAVCEPMASANGDVMLYWFDESDAINQALQKTPKLSFAFPLKDDQFKISNFSMKGYEAAIERMVNGIRDRSAPRT